MVFVRVLYTSPNTAHVHTPNVMLPHHHTIIFLRNFQKQWL